ncbi:glycosyltransferase family 39 protein [Candidatus Woesearchaeota archaeon]|nr:glycosyltransferase family 39 protein [Candidatus Woesearchaeota archaeon]
MKFKDKSIYVYFALYLLIQLYLIIKTPFIRWDESAFIGTGKYILSSGYSGLYESLRPSLLPLLLGIIWKLKLDVVFFGRLLILLFSLGNLYFFYKICREFFDEPISLLSTILLSTLPIYFVFSTKIMSGIMASFFVTSALYFFLNKRYYLCVILLGFGTITKFPVGMFFLMLMIYLLFRNKINYDNILLLSSLSLFYIITVSPYFIINYSLGFGFLRPFLDALWHQGNSYFSQQWYYYFLELIKQSWIFVFSLFGIYYCIKKKNYLILLIFLFPFLYFNLITNKQIRFFNLFMPFIVLISVYGLTNLLSKLKRGVGYFLLILLLMTNFIYFQHNFDYEMDYEKEVDELYTLKFLEHSNNLTIMTTHPLFSAYSDNKFIPIYFNAFEGYEIFKENYEKVDYFIYSDEFPCEVYPKADECEELKKKMYDIIQGGTQVHQDEYYIIFRND